MIGNIFAAIELLLKLCGLLDGFINYMDAQRLKQDEEKRQRRDKAVDDEKNAQTIGDADEAQGRVVDNLP